MNSTTTIENSRSPTPSSPARYGLSHPEERKVDPTCYPRRLDHLSSGQETQDLPPHCKVHRQELSKRPRTAQAD